MAAHEDLPRALTRLSEAEVPDGIPDAVMSAVVSERRFVPWRLAVGAGAFAAWAIAVQELVTWTADRLQGVV